MLNLLNAEAVIGSTQHRADKSPRTKITRMHSEELMRYSQDFGDLRAEVFLCRARGTNELEVFADTHSIFLRCDGAASRFEVTWAQWIRREETMTTQAMPLAPVQQPDGSITQARMGCGMGRVMVNGVCQSRAGMRQERRAMRRCARYSRGVCVQ
jgi:hypothetical protein